MSSREVDKDKRSVVASRAFWGVGFLDQWARAGTHMPPSKSLLHPPPPWKGDVFLTKMTWSNTPPVTHMLLINPPTYPYGGVWVSDRTTAEEIDVQCS